MTTALGKPARLLVGLGAGNSFSTIQSQSLAPDIYDAYLVGVGAGTWPYWNSPNGSYITDTAQSASALGAVPMFTLYQMATNGDGNISEINTPSFMTGYWSQARLMFQVIGSWSKPVLVNLEPDFWGYVEQQAPSGNPAALAAYVNAEPECTTQPNNAIGIAGCLLAMGRKYAPNAKIGFPPSLWSGTSASVAQYMVELGANHADFIVAQTSDRDAGCMEVASPPAECAGRGSGPFYWDETNLTSPNYTQSIDAWSTVRGVMGNLPILYWQTPMGVPSTTPGGTTQHYRDNHVHYMLTHAGQFTAIGVFAVVFSSGASSQTTISTDGGQFQTLFDAYLKTPAAYP
jgi:hypothetical protein